MHRERVRGGKAGNRSNAELTVETEVVGCGTTLTPLAKRTRRHAKTVAALLSTGLQITLAYAG
jgi:hypothetical protein